MSACAELLVLNFENFVKNNGEDRKYLLELDVENFVKILESDKLPITNESVLIDLVTEYI